MIKRLITQLKPLFPALFWLTLGVVSFLLLIEMQPSEVGWPYFDKVVHTCMFLTLGILGYIAYTKHQLAIWIGLAFYGVVTECLQSAYTETRLGSIHDWFADVTGILLSIAIIFIFKTIYLKQIFNGN